VKEGDHLFVFVRNQGALGGGNTGQILVASDTSDVFAVGMDGLVRGEGDRAGFVETLDAFVRHFQR
jgi:hypothetical protein